MSRERERLDEIAKKLKTELYATTSQMRRRHMLGPPGGGGGGGGCLNTITPCAACKLLRRRCAEDCPFSPYFSPHEPHKFAAVHKVFGASNVSKLLMEVDERQRADAANSLVYEANVRLRDPVYGCMGAISALQQEVQSLQSELHAVRTEILRYKYRELAAANTTIINAASSNAASLINPPSIPPSVSIAALHHHHHHHEMPQAPTTPPPPPPPTPPPPPPSIVVPPSSSSNSSSSLYAQPSCTTTTTTPPPPSFNTINANNNIPFFRLICARSKE